MTENLIVGEITQQVRNIAADVAPVKHGHWIYGEYDIPHCSECGHEIKPNCISAFCPSCGASYSDSLSETPLFCSQCGQNFDWSDDE